MLDLRRINSAKNMRRFYRLDVQPDLFCGFLLLKQWGRIGAGGRIKAERYESEATALDALRRHAERKRRHGYGSSERQGQTPRQGRGNLPFEA